MESSLICYVYTMLKSYEEGISLFVTHLTKRDWYRIYKYLWRNHCITAISKNSLVLLKIIIALEALYEFYSLSYDFFYMHRSWISILLEVLIFVVGLSLCIPLAWLIQTIRFSPQTFISFSEAPSQELRKLIDTNYPQAKITKFSNIFALPLDNSWHKWTVLVFMDYCVLYMSAYGNPNKKLRYTLSIIKRTDIDDETLFFKRPKPVCERIVELPNVKLHLK